VNTLRFNFRGVGNSEGQFDEGDGELADLLAVVDWLQKVRGKHDIWLAGFSFGACVAAKGAIQLEPKKLVTVAPAVDYVDMKNLAPILCDWVLVQGEKDDVVSPASVFSWAEQRDPQPVVIRFPEAGHFFHGQLAELRMRVE
jgi:alpha/beta superfamily hydrolase